MRLDRCVLAVFSGVSALALGVRAEDGSFPVRPPEDPVAFELAASTRPVFGRTEPLRLVYYITGDRGFDPLDRSTILREIRLIQDFYRHFGLEIPVEGVVHEVRGGSDGAPVAEQFDYRYIQGVLKKRGLYLSGRTVVFADFDVGLGQGMALTTINDENTARRECPRNHEGRKTWWCGRPENEHWGGIVHEVGHMFGLPHPLDAKANSVMARHWRFARDPVVGLTDSEIAALRGRFAASAAP